MAANRVYKISTLRGQAKLSVGTPKTLKRAHLHCASLRPVQGGQVLDGGQREARLRHGHGPQARLQDAPVAMLLGRVLVDELRQVPGGAALQVGWRPDCSGCSTRLLCSRMPTSLQALTSVTPTASQPCFRLHRCRPGGFLNESWCP